MASKAEKRYPDKAASKAPVAKDEAKPKAEAEATAGKPKMTNTGMDDPGPGDTESGPMGPVHTRQMAEMREMHTRHEGEAKTMRNRHMTELGASMDKSTTVKA